MIWSTLFITSVYFVIGAVLLLLIVRKHKEPQKVRESWTKYLVYLVIVGGMIALIYTGTLRYAAAGISVIALYEVFQVAIKRQKTGNKTFLLTLPPLFLMVYCFLWYADHLPLTFQLFVYTLVFVFDGFAQLTGQLLGKHALAPTISPAKTYEGLAGGFLLSGITAFLLAPTEWLTVLAWSGTCVFALAGDLYASYCKRVLGVKDYSNLIPGHGGILDRFDSLFGASVWMYLLSYLLPILTDHNQAVL